MTLIESVFRTKWMMNFTYWTDIYSMQISEPRREENRLLQEIIYPQSDEEGTYPTEEECDPTHAHHLAALTDRKQKSF